MEILVYIGAYITSILLSVLVIFYAERKVCAFIQDRYGPMEAGPYGIIQAVADLLKLLQKEDIVPSKADRILFKLAPIVVFTVIFTGFSAIPYSKSVFPNATDTGLFFILAVVSLDVIGLLMAGWGSSNRYAMIGAMRSIAQIVSYEIPVGICVLAVITITNTLNLQDICIQQSIGEPNFLFGIKSLGIDISHIGGFLTWNLFRAPVLIPVFIIFFIGTLAESNRAPFDLAEAESELVAGFHVEYSGFRFALFYLAEYAMMLLVSILAVILFLGGWNSPFPSVGSFNLSEWTSGGGDSIAHIAWGAFWILTKSWLLMASHVWIRWTLPRLRVDQLMKLCWKILTPLSLVFFVLACFWRLLM